MPKVEQHWQSWRFRDMGARQSEYVVYVRAKRWARLAMREIEAMHEKLTQNYIDRARQFMRTDRWPGLEPQPSALANALVDLADQRDKIVAAFDRENPARLADVHALGCECLRCAVDAARVA